VLFAEQTADSVMSGILHFEEVEMQFDPVRIRAHSQKFDSSVFIAAIEIYVQQAWSARLTREQAE
jgi:hypothetical protein